MKGEATRARAAKLALAAGAAGLCASMARGQAEPAPAPATVAPAQAPRGGDPFEGADLEPKAAVEPLSPAESAKLFLLPPGYRMEPVLTEPDVAEPMQIAFDGDGRLFVLELRGFMQDADGTGELDPTGRISVHADEDEDGTFERHAVFVDRLVFPRFVMPFGANAVLTMEANTDAVHRYTDTDGDWVADEKQLFTTGLGRPGNVEHQPASLTWALDNWLYCTVNAFRVRWTPGGILREPTAPNRAQWGVTQDDFGKVWFQGGASGLPSYFQFPIHYGAFDQPDQIEPGMEIPYGAAGLADYQAGMGSVRASDQTLALVSGAAGNDVFRGDRLPAELRGDYFYGEPVARIVRRIRPVVSEGLTRLRQVYQAERSEFIRTKDPLFRPVDVTTAPDGTLYVTDAYRGIIQQATWLRPGSYLRAKVEQYALDKVVRHGRIWRLTHEGSAPERRRPRMLQETPAELVAHLGHPNGWWRDTAQQLLVLAQDRAVVPALRELVSASTNPLARIHALWTLEGLGALEAELVRALLVDADAKLRIQALRVSETLYKAGDRSIADGVRARVEDESTDVVVQALLTLHVLKVADIAELVAKARAHSSARGVEAVGRALLTPPDNAFGRQGRGDSPAFTASELETMQRGDQIYRELCIACHGDDGRGAPWTGVPGSRMAPSFFGSERMAGHRDYLIRVLLHGMEGPIGEERYDGALMVAMGTNDDAWIAAIASYVRNTFGNTASFVTPAQVARVRAASAEREKPWTHAELVQSLPRVLAAEPTWKASASHNPRNAAGALMLKTWSSGVPQQPGMWFQVELPEAVELTEIAFQSPAKRPRAGQQAAPEPGDGELEPQGDPTPTPAPAPRVGTHPRAYVLELSLDGATWTQVATGEGTGTETSIAFPPATARFLRITQTAQPENAPPWLIQRLTLFRPPLR